MSMPRREFSRPSSNLPISIDEIYGQIRFKGFNAAGDPLGILLENDGTQRMQSILWNGAQIRELAESTGAPMVVNYGKATASITAMQVEATGQQEISLYGTDSGGTVDPLRTNDSKQLQVEVVPSSSTVLQIDPQLIAAAEADLWDPGADSGDMFDVEFLVVNVDGTNAVDVSVGQDVAGGGGLTAAEYFMFTETIPAKGSSGWRGPFRIGGDDHIRGVAGAANDAAIHLRVKKVKDV